MSDRYQWLQRFKVQVAEHEVARRWQIPASRGRISAASARQAIELTIADAQRTAGVPGYWRPYHRESLRYVTATCIERATTTPIRPHKQLALKPKAKAA